MNADQESKSIGVRPDVRPEVSCPDVMFEDINDKNCRFYTGIMLPEFKALTFALISSVHRSVNVTWYISSDGVFGGKSVFPPKTDVKSDKSHSRTLPLFYVVKMADGHLRVT